MRRARNVGVKLAANHANQNHGYCHIRKWVCGFQTGNEKISPGALVRNTASKAPMPSPLQTIHAPSFITRLSTLRRWIPGRMLRPSVEFYKRIFGWNIRHRSDGHLAFDDGTDQVSGGWRLERPDAPTPGFLVYVTIDSLANAGKIVQPIGGDVPEITARIRDPAGNVLAPYQEPG